MYTLSKSPLILKEKQQCKKDNQNHEHPRNHWEHCGPILEFLQLKLKQKSLTIGVFIGWILLEKGRINQFVFHVLLLIKQNHTDWNKIFSPSLWTIYHIHNFFCGSGKWHSIVWIYFYCIFKIPYNKYFYRINPPRKYITTLWVRNSFCKSACSNGIWRTKYTTARSRNSAVVSTSLWSDQWVRQMRLRL